MAYMVSEINDQEIVGDIQQNTLSRTRTFILAANDQDDAYKMFELGTDVPRLGDIYPGKSWLIFTSARVVPIQKANFKVVGSGSPLSGFQLFNGYATYTAIQYTNQDPVLEEERVFWGFEDSIEQVDIDANGKAILNSAGDRFDTLPTAEYSDMIFTHTRNYRTFSPVTASGHKNHINKGVWAITGMRGAERKFFAKHTSKVANVSADRRFTSAFGLYWTVTYQIKVRHRPKRVNGKDVELGWDRAILDEGYNTVSLIGQPGKQTLMKTPIKMPTYIVGEDGVVTNGPPERISTPVVLKKGNNGQVGIWDGVGDVPVLIFQIYPEMNFNGIFGA